MAEIRYCKDCRRAPVAGPRSQRCASCWVHAKRVRDRRRSRQLAAARLQAQLMRDGDLPSARIEQLLSRPRLSPWDRAQQVCKQRQAQ